MYVYLYIYTYIYIYIETDHFIPRLFCDKWPQGPDLVRPLGNVLSLMFSVNVQCLHSQCCKVYMFKKATTGLPR